MHISTDTHRKNIGPSGARRGTLERSCSTRCRRLQAPDYKSEDRNGSKVAGRFPEPCGYQELFPAARNRHLTQSAFSRRIAALETWMDAKLVDRSINPITLTPAGQMFRGAAADILRSMYAARNLVNGYDQFAASDQAVRFAVAHTLVFTLFPEWLKQLNGEVGHVTARVNAVNVPEGVQQLVEGECDLLLGYHHPQLPIVLDPNHFPFVNPASNGSCPCRHPMRAASPCSSCRALPMHRCRCSRIRRARSRQHRRDVAVECHRAVRAAPLLRDAHVRGPEGHGRGRARDRLAAGKLRREGTRGRHARVRGFRRLDHRFRNPPVPVGPQTRPRPSNCGPTS